MHLKIFSVVLWSFYVGVNDQSPAAIFRSGPIWNWRLFDRRLQVNIFDNLLRFALLEFYDIENLWFASECQNLHYSKIHLFLQTSSTFKLSWPIVFSISVMLGISTSRTSFSASIASNFARTSKAASTICLVIKNMYQIFWNLPLFRKCLSNFSKTAISVQKLKLMVWPFPLRF